VVLQRNCRAGCDKELRHRVLIHEFLDRIVGRRAQALAEISSTSSLYTSLRACSMFGMSLRQPDSSSGARSGGLRQITAPRPEAYAELRDSQTGPLTCHGAVI
jgi:hypothetical protein